MDYILVQKDELYHYGIKGMKWGVRKKSSSSGGSSRTKKLAKKAANKYVDKRIKKEQKRKDNIHKTVDRFGSLGVASVGAFGEYNRRQKFMSKTLTAYSINALANAYIASNSAKYYRAKGVDYARRAAIFGLSVSATKDTLDVLSDVGEAYVYNRQRRESRKGAG